MKFQDVKIISVVEIIIELFVVYLHNFVLIIIIEILK